MHIVFRLDKMSQDVALQVVCFNQRYAECGSKPFGKRYAHKQRPHQAWAKCYSHSRQLLFVDTGLFQRLVNNGHDVLLVCARGQFGHHATVCLVHSLTCCDIA